jgi:hypothetical protein
MSPIQRQREIKMRMLANNESLLARIISTIVTSLSSAVIHNGQDSRVHGTGIYNVFSKFISNKESKDNSFIIPLRSSPLFLPFSFRYSHIRNRDICTGYSTSRFCSSFSSSLRSLFSAPNSSVDTYDLGKNLGTAGFGK